MKMNRLLGTCVAATLVTGIALSASAADKNEAQQVYGTFQIPGAAAGQSVTRGAAPVGDSQTVAVPSDAEVMRRAAKSGAKLTRGGVVLPKGTANTMPAPTPANVQLTDDEKAMPVGKPEKPGSTRGGNYAYIFIKPQNVAGLGHIGWGYWAPNMGYYVCGSTENYSASPYIGAGGNNDWWCAAYYNEADMFNKFKQMGYYAFKKKYVPSPNPGVAWGRAIYTRDNGFRGVGWNCLDHTYYILEGYGVTGMPWKQTNPAPNGWFNAFPGTGYQLP